MRLAFRRLALAAAVLASITCAFPTDVGSNAYVTIVSPGPVLLRGGDLTLEARVWLRLSGGDSVELKNVALQWSSGDTHLATVTSAGSSTGRVTGVNSGHVEIRAVAGGYDASAAGVYSLRVANPLEIDSITPDTVRYGERVTMYGVGVGELFFAGLGPGFLSADSLSVAGNPRGLGQLSFWVPYPSRTGNIFAAGSGQLIAAPDSTVVLPYDLYEPNEAAPAAIDLDGPRPIPSVSVIRFFNPALAFEDLRNGTPVGADWYRFKSATTAAPFSFILIAPALGGAHIATLGGADGSWTVGSGVSKCKGYDFRVETAPSDSLIVALRRLPSDTVDLFAAYVQQGRYFLAVTEGYVTTDPRIQPDRFEEDDLCGFADENFADPTKAIDLTSPFSDNLTIDNPHDVDWLRFRVPGVVPQVVSVRSAAHPLQTIDRTDIDLYLLTVPDGSHGLDPVARDVAHGSTGAITQLLDPGDYYLVVADSAGIATPYSLCIAAAASCTPPPAAASSGPVAALPATASMLTGLSSSFARAAYGNTVSSGRKR
jgi:hypothetical protein